MTNHEVALEYLSRFCFGDIAGLEPLLAEDISFTGTFYSFGSAAEYLDGLRSDRPDKCDYKIVSVTENDDSVAVFYEYQKPDRTLQIAQLFRFRDQKISEILPIFDGRGVTQPV